MRHSKVYVAVMNALNEEIADKSAIIKTIKDLQIESDNLDLLDSEYAGLFKLVNLKNEIADLIKHKEEKGDL